MKAAVFLDKDGMLVDNVEHTVDLESIVIADGAAAALARLRDCGYVFVIVSNQPGVIQGRFTMRALDAVEARLKSLLAAQSIELLGCYWCPHDGPTGSDEVAPCDCRKPAPGLLLQAARDHGIDLARSWMVGDVLDDVEAGRRAGCRTVLVDDDGETLDECTHERMPDRVATTFAEVALAILAESPEAREATMET